jgi:hypothetical protein
LVKIQELSLSPWEEKAPGKGAFAPASESVLRWAKASLSR